jgi:hypothetical protein
VTLVLIPMVHIADAAFYVAVRDRLNACDAIIFEGVHSFRVRLLTLAYRLPAKRRSLSLVLQSDAIRMSDLTARLVHGDMGGDVFAIHWAEIPLHQRIALMVLAPLYGAAMYVFGSRERFSRGHTVDSLPAREERVTDDARTSIEDVVLHERDRHLVTRIEAYLASEANQTRTAAVLFGAAHMPAVAAHLLARHGYRVARSRWVTAIALSP